ncbi:hypothetical protein VQ042_25300 [Aurantimonas sp. A2-1-M11]|uniref:hypothetical protein n=1 Tax=Aurantimonas sp. A2-1-M11 TaxID=3113712 RepID=UPI002F942930
MDAIALNPSFVRRTALPASQALGSKKKPLSCMLRNFARFWAAVIIGGSRLERTKYRPGTALDTNKRTAPQDVAYPKTNQPEVWSLSFNPQVASGQ